jgi:hypothetical protein
LKTFTRRGRYRVTLSVVDKRGMRSQKRFFVAVGSSRVSRPGARSR